MRTLKFIVNGQVIEKDPKCIFDNLVPGTNEYLKAEFAFSSEWDDCVKVAAFYSMMGKEYPAQILIPTPTGEACLIPTEALKKESFKIQIFGKKGDYKINTHKLTIKQDGGKHDTGD